VLAATPLGVHAALGEELTEEQIGDVIARLQSVNTRRK